MIAVDTNVLIYAHRAEMALHETSAAAVRRLATSAAAWAIPWPCLHEFLSVVTHPRIFVPPSSIEEALDQISAWASSPSLVLIGESRQHLSTLTALVKSARIGGPRVRDARVAAICLDHGVRALVTQDRDFSRFPSLRTRSVLEGPLAS